MADAGGVYSLSQFFRIQPGFRMSMSILPSKERISMHVYS